jgi:hypothetical protein
MSAWLTIAIETATKIGGSLVKLVKMKHDEAKQQTIESQKKALESVGESIKKETEIENKQGNIESSDVGKFDGGVSADDWNSGK